MLHKPLKSVIINSIQEVGGDGFIISFDKSFNFTPGQVIGITDSYDLPPRLYSILSSPVENEVKILFNIKKEGNLSPRLSRLKKGEKIFITSPSGNFHSDEKEAFWIASGTGIAPFVSMLDSGLGKYKTLIHGARALDNFYFSERFSTFKGNYIRCCSGEKADKVFHGRLTKYLSERPFFKPNIKYYLCGSAEMVVQSRDILISKNIPYENIIAEIYF
jgi:ferredoxin/flavodoxin---NADP+ reductase